VDRSRVVSNEEQDQLDRRLIEVGDFAPLLAAYYPIIVQRARLLLAIKGRRPPPEPPLGDGYEVAHWVVLRLLAELRRGKQYKVPFRVVVRKVTEWTVSDYLKAKAQREELEPVEHGDDEIEFEANDPYQEFEQDYDLARVFADLPSRTREVFELRYRQGLEIDAIAQRLNMTRNAVDQALYRGYTKLATLGRDAFHD